MAELIVVDMTVLVVVNVCVALALAGVFAALWKVNQNTQVAIKKIDAVMAKLISFRK